MTWRGSTTVQERIFASLPYLLPLIRGLEFGSFLLRQFPALAIVFVPLQPLILIYTGIPLAGLVIFFALFLLVVRNESISHFIRFNTMQAILLEIVLYLCSLLLGIFRIGGANFVFETIANTIFLGLLAVVAFSILQSLRGRYAEIPALSDAVHMQVR